MVYYVDPLQGVDNGDCLGAGCQTVAYAISQIGSSDLVGLDVILILLSGVYSINRTLC